MNKRVLEILERAEAELGRDLFHFGHAHIVFSDNNLETEHIHYCLVQSVLREDESEDEKATINKYLIELLAIPEGERLQNEIPRL